MCKYDPNSICRDEFLNKNVLMDDCEHCPENPNAQAKPEKVISFRESLDEIDKDLQYMNKIMGECIHDITEKMRLLAEKAERESKEK